MCCLAAFIWWGRGKGRGERVLHSCCLLPLGLVLCPATSRPFPQGLAWLLFVALPLIKRCEKDAPSGALQEKSTGLSPVPRATTGLQQLGAAPVTTALGPVASALWSRVWWMGGTIVSKQVTRRGDPTSTRQPNKHSPHVRGTLLRSEACRSCMTSSSSTQSLPQATPSRACAAHEEMSNQWSHPLEERKPLSNVKGGPIGQGL